jgi:predicted O-methyltransferase YrrM
MDITTFRSRFDAFFPSNELERPALFLEDTFVRSTLDTCFDVPGMASLKKLKLLNLAFSCLPAGEGYLEVGTYRGKSLISAMLGNPARSVYACDNFSLFTETNSLVELKSNLQRYHLLKRVTIFDQDFTTMMDDTHVPTPIGCYFYDGAHDEQSQYEGIKLAEPLLADNALVIVDDWRLASDSGSYARDGTERAIRESHNEWVRLYELPARFNGDQAMWWNGVGVFAFRRR